MGSEGGYVNRASDPGGETNWGISKRSYPNLDIKSLTREQAKKIYLEDFWLDGSMPSFHGAIAFQVFDAAVNHGPQTAIRLLQRAVGVADDGNVGPVTRAAVRAMSVTDVLLLFMAERFEFWTRCSDWKNSSKGWVRRGAENLRYIASDT